MSRKRGARLRDFTPKENKTHKQSCQLGKQACSRCRYWDLIRQVCHAEPRPAEGHPERGGACQVALDALKHDDEKGGAWAGCVACHAYAEERPHKARPNVYADFSIGAAKLLDTKAAVLLRHASTRLHLQAVASLLDVPLRRASEHYFERNSPLR